MKLSNLQQKKLQIRVHYKKNRNERQKGIITENEMSWLLSFLDYPDTSYATPGEKDQCYVDKENGEINMYKSGIFFGIYEKLIN